MMFRGPGGAGTQAQGPAEPDIVPRGPSLSWGPLTLISMVLCSQVPKRFVISGGFPVTGGDAKVQVWETGKDMGASRQVKMWGAMA